MEMVDKSNTILSTETQELLEARDVELKKVLKLKLILNEIRCLNLGSQESPEIKRALKLVSVADYVRLGDDQGHLLDLQECSRCPPLSYTDSKVVRTHLAANLRATLTPIAELGDKIRSELPYALTKDEDVELTPGQQEIIGLQKEQRACLEKLAQMSSHKCALMMKAAELKMGPHLGHELKVQQAHAQLLQTKADLLRIYFINEIFSRTDHSLKAYKEVDKYLDELLSANSSVTETGRR
ncbi:augmin complex subunit dgt2 [Drosophila montana]|uniref:augmin complex subunit dgt2 n=1 Tax=Drosophila montana TaxID=40370 RepID=UPI00313DCAF5